MARPGASCGWNFRSWSAIRTWPLSLDRRYQAYVPLRNETNDFFFRLFFSSCLNRIPCVRKADGTTHTIHVSSVGFVPPAREPSVVAVREGERPSGQSAEISLRRLFSSSLQTTLKLGNIVHQLCDNSRFRDN